MDTRITFENADKTPRKESEPTTINSKRHSRNVSLDQNFDWDSNVVNFISNFLHPGIYRRKSNFQSTTHVYSDTLPRKTHRRIASTSTHMHNNPLKTHLYSPKGHSRNVSDPGKIFYFNPEIKQENQNNYSPASLEPISDKDSLPQVITEIKDPNMKDSIDGQDVKKYYYCKFGCFRIRAFSQLITTILCFMVLTQSIVMSGYVSSMFTTLERRFDLTNQQAGYIVSSYETGAVLSIVFVSLFHNEKKNRPRVISISGLLMTIGFIFFTIPHYISGYYEPDIKNNASDCSMINWGFASLKTDYTLALPIFVFSSLLAGLGASPIYILAPTYLWDNLSPKKYPMYSACFYCCAAVGPALGFILASVFLSIYIDHPKQPIMAGDGVEEVVVIKPGDDLFLGAWWMGMLVNSALILLTTIPAFSFPLKFADKEENEELMEEEKESSDDQLVIAGDGSLTEGRPKFYQDNGLQNEIQLKESDLNQINPNLYSPNETMDGTSKAIKNIEEDTNPQAFANNNNSNIKNNLYEFNGRKLKPILEGKSKLCLLKEKLLDKLLHIKTICRVVFTNYIWLGVTIVNVFEQSIVSAFVTYAAKYMETMFRVPPYLASIITGGVVVPSALLGVIFGALMMQHFRPNIRTILKWMHLTMLLALGTNLGLILLGCNENQIAGLTAKYNGDAWPYHTFPSNSYAKNLTAKCNQGCPDNLPFDPVCWESALDGRKMTYYSACHAGCKNVSTKYDLDQCTCMDSTKLTPDLINQTDFGKVSTGLCSITCPNFYPFLFVLFFHIFLTTLHQNPSNVMTLASVDSEYGSQALGLQVFFIRVLAFVPAPIYFGKLIDSVCQQRSVPHQMSASSICKNLLTLPQFVNGANSTSRIETLTGVAVEGVCKAYSPLGLAFMTMGGLFLLKVCSMIGLIITYQLIRRDNSLDESVQSECSSPDNDKELKESL